MHDEPFILCSPEDAGFSADRWAGVLELAQQLTQVDLPALAFQVVRRGRTPGAYHFGWQSPGQSAPLRNDAIFLTASITKPIVALAVMLLVERGEITLSDRVARFFPQVRDSSKQSLSIRHLLTHTSGLPDMLPNNRALRMTKAPVERFIDGACAVGLDFVPGQGVQYQSAGYALLAGIIETVTGQTLPRFLETNVFGPVGMDETFLGLPDSWYEGPHAPIERVAGIRVPPEQQEGADWNWNSRYWQQMGCPWGGIFSTPTDLCRLGQMHLDMGRSGRSLVCSAGLVSQATSNQLTSMPDIPEADRRARGWGLGWRMQWPGHVASFGDLVGPRTYGHWGATGTLMWVDPDAECVAVLLSTEPLERESRPLVRLNNAICAAME